MIRRVAETPLLRPFTTGLPPLCPRKDDYSSLVGKYTSKYKINRKPIVFPRAGTQPSFYCDITHTFVGPYYDVNANRDFVLYAGNYSQIQIIRTNQNIIIKTKNTSGTITPYKTYDATQFYNSVCPHNILVCVQAAGGCGGHASNDGSYNYSGGGGGAGGCGLYIIPLSSWKQVNITLGTNGYFNSGDTGTAAVDSFVSSNDGMTSYTVYAGGNAGADQNGHTVPAWNGGISGRGNYAASSGSIGLQWGLPADYNTFTENNFYGGNGYHIQNNVTYKANHNIKDNSVNIFPDIYQDGQPPFVTYATRKMGAAGSGDTYAGGGGCAAPCPIDIGGSGYIYDGIKGRALNEDGRNLNMSKYIGCGGGGMAGGDVSTNWPTAGGRAACKIFLGYSS